MHQRAPAAGNSEQIAGDLFSAGGELAVVVNGADGHAVQAAAVVGRGVRHCAAGQHPCARFDGGRCHLAELGTGIHDDGDHHAGAAEVSGKGVGAVIGGADDHALPGGHGVAVQVAADGGGEHDAGPVVVLEHQRTFVGTGGQYNLARTDVPDTLAGDSRRRGRGQVVGTVLDGDDIVGVVGAEGRGAVQDGGLGAGNEFGFHVRHPLQGRLALDGLGQVRCCGAGQERASQLRLVVQQHDTGTGPHGFPGRGQACGAAADNQDISVDVLLVVLGMVLLRVKLAQAVEELCLQPIHQSDGGGGEH